MKIDRQWVRKEYHIPFQLIPPLHARYDIYICMYTIILQLYIVYNTHTHTCVCVCVFFFVHRSNSKGVRFKGAVDRFTMWHHVAPRCDVAMERFCAWLRRRLADFKAGNYGVTHVPNDRKEWQRQKWSCLTIWWVYNMVKLTVRYPVKWTQSGIPFWCQCLANVLRTPMAQRCYVNARERLFIAESCGQLDRTPIGCQTPISFWYLDTFGRAAASLWWDCDRILMDI